jgi:hypothetical protein
MPASPRCGLGRPSVTDRTRHAAGCYDGGMDPTDGPTDDDDGDTDVPAPEVAEDGMAPIISNTGTDDASGDQADAASG